MKILVNGKEAVINKASSFEYNLVNQLFEETEGYSLAIKFPLKDCLENQKIFGFIHHLESKIEPVSFHCSIIDLFFYKEGLLTITDVDDVCVSAQFLEGKAKDNFEDRLSKLYINEIGLGYAPSGTPTGDQLLARTDALGQVYYTTLQSLGFQAIRVHENTTDTYYNQCPIGVTHAAITHGKEAYQIYLYRLVERVFTAIGLECDLSAWKETWHRYILVCNTIPDSFGLHNFKYCMPHWTVKEFLHQVELFLSGIFVFSGNKVTFYYLSQMYNKDGEEKINNVINDFEAEVGDDDYQSSRMYKSLSYKDRGDNAWKEYSCDWIIDYAKANNMVLEFDSVLEYIDIINDMVKGQSRTSTRFPWYEYDESKLVYFKNEDFYFLPKITESNIVREGENVIRREMNGTIIGEYQPSVVDKDADEEVLNFNPISYNWYPFSAQNYFYEITVESINKTAEGDPNPLRTLIQEGRPTTTEFFDRLYFGYIPPYTVEHPFPYNSGDDAMPKFRHNEIRASIRGSAESPDITYSFNQYGCSFELRNKIDESKWRLPSFDGKIKYKISFLSDRIPNINSIFLIRGMRYICKQLICNFSENGKSQLLKGEFYRIID